MDKKKGFVIMPFKDEFFEAYEMLNQVILEHRPKTLNIEKLCNRTKKGRIGLDLFALNAS